MEIINVSYWAWFATINLILLTYDDFKHKMMVDDRKNFFMLGITFSLITHIPTNLWYLLLLIGVTLVYTILGKKYIKSIGEADFNTLGWIMYGYGIISVYKMLWFMVFFAGIAGLYMLVKYVYCRIAKLDKNTPTPFYPVILLSFIFNSWLFGLY